MVTILTIIHLSAAPHHLMGAGTQTNGTLTLTSVYPDKYTLRNVTRTCDVLGDIITIQIIHCYISFQFKGLTLIRQRKQANDLLRIKNFFFWNRKLD